MPQVKDQGKVTSPRVPAASSATNLVMNNRRHTEKPENIYSYSKLHLRLIQIQIVELK